MDTMEVEFVWTKLDGLFESLRSADPADLARMLAEGADPNLRDGSGHPLLVDACGDEPWRYDMLVAAGAQLEERDLPSALNCACYHANYVILERLLPAVAALPPETWSNQALLGAVASGKTEVVDRVLAAGALIDARDPWGRTPFHHAAGVARDITVMQHVLQAGADLQAADNDGATALDLVIRRVGIGCPDECPLRDDEKATEQWLRNTIVEAQFARLLEEQRRSDYIPGRLDSPTNFAECVLTRKLSSDRVATCFVAHRRDDHRGEVMVRILHDHLAEAQGRVEEFLAEGRAGLALGTGAEVPVLEVGEADGRWYWVVEFEAGMRRALVPPPVPEWRPLERWLP